MKFLSSLLFAVITTGCLLLGYLVFYIGYNATVFLNTNYGNNIAGLFAVAYGVFFLSILVGMLAQNND